MKYKKSKELFIPRSKVQFLYSECSNLYIRLYFKVKGIRSSLTKKRFNLNIKRVFKENSPKEIYKSIKISYPQNIYICHNNNNNSVYIYDKDNEDMKNRLLIIDIFLPDPWNDYGILFNLNDADQFKSDFRSLIKSVYSTLNLVSSNFYSGIIAELIKKEDYMRTLYYNELYLESIGEILDEAIESTPSGISTDELLLFQAKFL